MQEKNTRKKGQLFNPSGDELKDDPFLLGFF